MHLLRLRMEQAKLKPADSSGVFDAPVATLLGVDFRGSQISECLSAGTGCGWCVPMLKKIHKEICGDKQPWWREVEPDTIGDVDPEKWSAGRQQYIADGKGKPPENSAE